MINLLRILSLCVATLAGFILTSGANEQPWQRAKNVPFQIKSGLLLADEAPQRRSATLSLVCDSDGQLRLVLVTRLPGRDFGIVLGQNVPASLFVNGIKQEQEIAVDVVAVGRPLGLVESWFNEEDEAEPDTITSPPLSPGVLNNLENWFMPSRPNRVSVMGIYETGVFMKGVVDGAEIKQFRTICR